MHLVNDLCGGEFPCWAICCWQGPLVRHHHSSDCIRGLAFPGSASPSALLHRHGPESGPSHVTKMRVESFFCSAWEIVHVTVILCPRHLWSSFSRAALRWTACGIQSCVPVGAWSAIPNQVSLVLTLCQSTFVNHGYKQKSHWSGYEGEGPMESDDMLYRNLIFLGVGSTTIQS